MAMVRRPEQQPKVWSPRRELEDVERRIDRYMGNLFDFRSFPTLWSRRPTGASFWVPRIELIEHEDKYTLRAELPGMKMEDIDVSVTDNTLTISGEKKQETTVNKEDYLYREQDYGGFRRSIQLPSEVVVPKIEATYDNGILEVRLPKSPEAKPRKIQVHVKGSTK